MGYWWCDNCQSEKSPVQVTFEETCTLCGEEVEWFNDDEGPLLEEVE